MAKFTTMLSVWLWGGIFVFLYLYFHSRKEIKIAKLESIHLCVIFTICCFVGLPAAIMEIFNLWGDEEDEEFDEDCEYTDEELEEKYSREAVEDLENIKNEIDLFLSCFR